MIDVKLTIENDLRLYIQAVVTSSGYNAIVPVKLYSPKVPVTARNLNKLDRQLFVAYIDGELVITNPVNDRDRYRQLLTGAFYTAVPLKTISRVRWEPSYLAEHVLNVGPEVPAKAVEFVYYSNERCWYCMTPMQLVDPRLWQYY